MVQCHLRQFGVDALQAAFSAKYYELAHKCKNWERYAAQLRARLEALDIDNRILRETSAAQQRQIVFLEAENAALKDQSEMRELRACEVEQRVSHANSHFRSRHDIDPSAGHYSFSRAVDLA